MKKQKIIKDLCTKLFKPDLTQIKACLTLRRPIICGFSVPKQYDDPNWNTSLDPSGSSKI